jgi:hypothetical protein
MGKLANITRGNYMVGVDELILEVGTPLKYVFGT